MRSSLLFLSLPVLALSACAHTNSQREGCANTDYYQMGLQDGQSGLTRDHLTAVQAHCSELGEPVALDQFDNGYLTGLNGFCTSERATQDANALTPSPACQQAKIGVYVDAYNDQLSKVRDAREKQLQDAQKREGQMQEDMNAIDRQKAEE